ncbi:hypothetical protein ACWGLF_34700 [Streptomyces puniciscabiei]
MRGLVRGRSRCRTRSYAAPLKVSFPHPGNGHAPDAFAVCPGCGSRERVRRWAQLHVAQAVFPGRHGIRRARQGARLDPLVAFAGHLAELLTEAGTR